MNRGKLPQTSRILVEFGNPKMRLFCKRFIHTPHAQKFHSRFSFGATNHTLFLLQDLPMAYMLHSPQHTCLHSCQHACSCNNGIGSLAQFKNVSTEKKSPSLKNSSDFMPQTTGQLRSNFSVVDDLQEPPNQSTPPHQAPALHQRTGCSQ